MAASRLEMLERNADHRKMESKTRTMQQLVQKLNSLMGRNSYLTYSLFVVVGMWLVLAVWGAFNITRNYSHSPEASDLYRGPLPYPDEGPWLLLTPWERWDAAYYLRIAQEGYDPKDASPSFFPLFPILLRVVGTSLAGNYLLAGALVCLIATLVAYAFLYRTSRELIGEDVAKRAVLFWAIFPSSYYFFGGYAESLLAAASVTCLFLMRHGRWKLASLSAMIATLSRPVGFLIAIPLAIQALSKGSMRERLIALVPVAAAAAAMGAWMLYLQLAFGDSLLWVHAEEVWQRVFVLPGQTVIWTAQNIVTGKGHVGNNVVDLGLTCLALYALVAGFKRLPISFSIYALAMVLVPLLSYAGSHADLPMTAASRRVLVAFPVFILLADRWNGKIASFVWVALSFALLLILFAGFVQWFWIA